MGLSKLPKSRLTGKTFEEIMDMDYGHLKIDREMQQRYAHRYSTGFRIDTGRFYTPKEYEKHRKEVLSRPLP